MIIEPSIKANFPGKTLENNEEQIRLAREKEKFLLENLDLRKENKELKELIEELKSEIETLKKKNKKGGE